MTNETTASEREAEEAFERLLNEQKWVPGMPKLAGARPAFVSGFLAARAALPAAADQPPSQEPQGSSGSLSESGVEAGTQDAASAFGRWVPVAERLPTKYEEVLIAFEGQMAIGATGQWTGSAHDKHGWSYPSENNGICDDGSDPIVTHWMPIPDVPGLNAGEQA